MSQTASGLGINPIMQWATITFQCAWIISGPGIRMLEKMTTTGIHGDK